MTTLWTPTSSTTQKKLQRQTFCPDSSSSRRTKLRGTLAWDGAAIVAVTDHSGILLSNQSFLQNTSLKTNWVVIYSLENNWARQPTINQFAQKVQYFACSRLVGFGKKYEQIWDWILHRWKQDWNEPCRFYRPSVRHIAHNGRWNEME